MDGKTLRSLVFSGQYNIELPHARSVVLLLRRIIATVVVIKVTECKMPWRMIMSKNRSICRSSLYV